MLLSDEEEDLYQIDFDVGYEELDSDKTVSTSRTNLHSKTLKEVDEYDLTRNKSSHLAKNHSPNVDVSSITGSENLNFDQNIMTLKDHVSEGGDGLNANSYLSLELSVNNRGSETFTDIEEDLDYVQKFLKANSSSFININKNSGEKGSLRVIHPPIELDDGVEKVQDQNYDDDFDDDVKSEDSQSINEIDRLYSKIISRNQSESKTMFQDAISLEYDKLEVGITPKQMSRAASIDGTNLQANNEIIDMKDIDYSYDFIPVDDVTNPENITTTGTSVVQFSDGLGPEIEQRRQLPELSTSESTSHSQPQNQIPLEENNNLKIRTTKVHTKASPRAQKSSPRALTSPVDEHEYDSEAPIHHRKTNNTTPPKNLSLVSPLATSSPLPPSTQINYLKLRMHRTPSPSSGPSIVEGYQPSSTLVSQGTKRAIPLEYTFIIRKKWQLQYLDRRKQSARSRLEVLRSNSLSAEERVKELNLFLKTQVLNRSESESRALRNLHRQEVADLKEDLQIHGPVEEVIRKFGLTTSNVASHSFMKTGPMSPVMKRYFLNEVHVDLPDKALSMRMRLRCNVLFVRLEQRHEKLKTILGLKASHRNGNYWLTTDVDFDSPSFLFLFRDALEKISRVYNKQISGLHSSIFSIELAIEHEHRLLDLYYRLIVQLKSDNVEYGNRIEAEKRDARKGTKKIFLDTLTKAKNTKKGTIDFTLVELCHRIDAACSRTEQLLERGHGLIDKYINIVTQIKSDLDPNKSNNVELTDDSKVRTKAVSGNVPEARIFLTEVDHNEHRQSEVNEFSNQIDIENELEGRNRPKRKHLKKKKTSKTDLRRSNSSMKLGAATNKKDNHKPYLNYIESENIQVRDRDNHRLELLTSSPYQDDFESNDQNTHGFAVDLGPETEVSPDSPFFITPKRPVHTSKDVTDRLVPGPICRNISDSNLRQSSSNLDESSANQMGGQRARHLRPISAPAHPSERRSRLSQDEQNVRYIGGNTEQRTNCEECGRFIKGKGKQLPTENSIDRAVLLESFGSSLEKSMLKSFGTSAFSDKKSSSRPVSPSNNSRSKPFLTQSQQTHIFCTWKCAHKWNEKNSHRHYKYHNRLLIDIAAGKFHE